MQDSPKPIAEAFDELRNHLSEIGRVYEWAYFMGYDDPKMFGEKFLQFYDIRPHKAMDYIRLKSIIHYLRASDTYTNHQIACLHSIPNEKALNNYTNYHLGLSPTDIKSMPESKLDSIFEKLGSKSQG